MVFCVIKSFSINFIPHNLIQSSIHSQMYKHYNIICSQTKPSKPMNRLDHNAGCEGFHNGFTFLFFSSSRYFPSLRFWSRTNIWIFFIRKDFCLHRAQSRGESWPLSVCSAQFTQLSSARIWVGPGGWWYGEALLAMESTSKGIIKL